MIALLAEPLSRERMSNVVSHSLPKTELFSAPGSRRRERSLSAWRRSPFASHRKISTSEPLKTKKILRSQSLGRALRCGEVVTHPRQPEFFKFSTSRVLQTGETPRNQAFADSPTGLAPEQPEKFKNRATKVLQTLKMTDRQWLARGPVPVIPGEPRVSAAREGDPRSARP